MNDFQAPRLTVGTNLKMHQTPAETDAFVSGLLEALHPAIATGDGVQLFVIPPFTSLPAAVAAQRASRHGAPLWIGAQNMHWDEEGAYTGEISSRMLTGVGVDLVLLGHAERRQFFHESDEALSRKVPAALAAGLRVLLAIGETAEERGWGVGNETISRQLKIALSQVDATSASSISIAYEPVWSIGSGGTPAEPEDVQPIAATIRQTLRETLGDSGNLIPILYGGSVNLENCGGFIALDEIDGLFIGRAAWTVEGFKGIVNAALDNARG